MRKLIAAAAFAAFLLVASPSTSSAQVVVQSYGTPVYSYSYVDPGYVYTPVYSYPVYSYAPVYSYPAYGGFSVGFGSYPWYGWGGHHYYGGWGHAYHGGWSGYHGGYHGGWGGHHHH